MTSYVGSIVVGIICIVLGVGNMRGNISSLHSYHRHRIAEEDRAIFGRKVGLGTVIAGASICVMGIMQALAEYTATPILATVGTVALIVGLIVGLGLSFYAIIKYNKGLF